MLSMVRQIASAIFMTLPKIFVTFIIFFKIHRVWKSRKFTFRIRLFSGVSNILLCLIDFYTRLSRDVGNKRKSLYPKKVNLIFGPDLDTTFQNFSTKIDLGIVSNFWSFSWDLIWWFFVHLGLFLMCTSFRPFPLSFPFYIGSFFMHILFSFCRVFPYGKEPCSHLESPGPLVFPTADRK